MNDKTLRLLEFDVVRRRLADHTTFSGGRQLALGLEPDTEPAGVRARLAATSEARDYVDRRGSAPLAGAHDLRPEIESATRGKTLLPGELLEIRDTIEAARRTARAIGRESSRWSALAAMAEPLDGFAALHDAIAGALDDDGQVLDGASPALARIRREMRVAHDRLVRRLEGMLGGQAAGRYLQEPLITQRGGRYVIPVKSEFRTQVEGVVHDTSDSGATVFVEPLAVVELGNRHRELQIEEDKEIDRILRALSGHVADEADALGETIGALARLDLAFACGALGYALRAVAPEVVDADAPRLRFPRARHPLLDPSTVVPIDVWLGDDFRLLVITGPNTGGKTVALKTIGLLVLMAQSGLHVPAGDGAELAVFDGVFADIGDEQSIEQSLSTFSGHMTNIIALLEAATERSLVLLDELGAGTDPVEGAALAGALLEHLRERGIATAASTHYSELKVYAHATEGVANASVEFDVESLRPTYELTIGLPGRSNALTIARRLGLPDAIIDDARGGLATTDVHMEEMLAEIKTARDQVREDVDAAAERRVEAERWAARLESATRDVERERDDILEAARRQAAGELEEARRAIERLERRAERAADTKDAFADVLERLERVDAALSESPGSERRPAPSVEALEPGDPVRVRSFGQAGELTRIDDRQAEVQLGRIRMTVALTDLEALPKPDAPEPEPEPDGGRVSLQRAADAPDAVPGEVDLRGLRVADGIARLEHYLSDALLEGRPWVRVIHGHGTGAMKQAVRDALRRHREVVRARPGERGEGGDGATVAYLE